MKRARPGFTLVELLVAIGIVSVLLAILLPVVGRVREQATVLQCAANLRELSTAMVLYANAQPDHGYPRAPYDPSKNKLQLDNAGYMVPDTFGKSGYVSENNVPASLFLLMKTQRLSPTMFVCPATDAVPWNPAVDPQKSSNWEKPEGSLTYSLAAPYPTAAAEKGGFAWRGGLPAEFAVLADANPGTRGGSDPLNNVTGPRHDAAAAALRAANSNNHRNRGQNVAYGDGHVEFCTTPYCGRLRKDGIRDHIYTAGAGDGGICGELAVPVDKYDSVCLPTDDPGGK
ncbi:MAG TPA: type II secretion system protein [Humisphaera sp.]